MSQSNYGPADISAFERILPKLRRYARALAGDQLIGDDFAIAAIEQVLENPAAMRNVSTPDVALFRTFFRIFGAAGDAPGPESDERAAQAQKYMRILQPSAQHALLLFAVEEFTVPEIAEIMETGDDDVERLIETARAQMKQMIAGKVMVIEDESLIALDLTTLVEDMGHEVTGAAATYAEAIALAGSDVPDLILSDIQLADGTSGIDAVDDILSEAGRIPVIFITAFPERLLTGQKREPAFVITKPYSKVQLQSAVSQAMFFRSSANIEG